MALTNKQRGVRKGVIGGAILTLAGLAGGIAFIPTELTPESAVADRLAYVLKADILVVFWLLHCIGRLGMHRFKSPEDIDGAGLTAGTPQAKVLRAVLQNTLEQVVFAVIVHMIWVVVMPVSWITAVLAAAMLFSIGRFLFIRGYSGGGPARALGFALTFYPTQLMFLIATVTVIWRLVS